MFNLQIQNLLNGVLPKIMYDVSEKVAEFDNPTINYHPQNEDKFYKTTLPSKLEIREFILEKNEDKLKEYIKQNIFSSSLIKISKEKSEKNKTIDTTEKQKSDSVKEKFIQDLIKSFPSKAYIIKTDHTINVLKQYDKVKQEMSNLPTSGNDLTNIKPKSILYSSFVTAYSIEKNVVEWQKGIQEKFFDSVGIDLLGQDYFKKFITNAAYIPSKNILSLGTFVSYKDGKVYNASQDSDVVFHEVGHATLDKLRPLYIHNTFHLESAAVHEAFGDINAFLAAAKDPNISVNIDDLYKPNFISSISEYFGPAIYTQLEVEKQILKNNPYGDISQINVNKPIRELSSLVNYKDYKELSTDEKEPHHYSLPLSTTFYKAFSEYAKSVGNVKEAADEFFKVFSIGTKISPVATSTMPEFYKSFIVADILYNDSKLSNFLVKAANESGLLKVSLDDIKKEIEDSKNIDLSTLKDDLLRGNDISGKLLEILKKTFPDFSIINDLKANVVPGMNGGINIEATFTYPVGVMFDGKEVPVLGGVLLVLDKNLNLIYSNIEKPSLEKVSYMQDYANIIAKKYDKSRDEDIVLD